MGRTADYSRQSCSIAAALGVIGDPWTLLVIRDAFNGVSRFEQWQDNLGVARNVLAARIKSLVQHGVLEPQPYCARPPRNEYVLTAKGKDLYGVLVTLHGWGAKHIYGDADCGVGLTHKTCGQPLVPRIACGCCTQIVRPRDVQMTQAAQRPARGDVASRTAAA